MKTIDYREWSREHPWRALVCVILMIMLAWVLFGIVQNTQAQAAGCNAAKSQTKHIEAFSGTDLSNTYLKVRWCWASGRIYEHQEKIVNNWVNCVVGWCLNWRTIQKNAGWYWANNSHDQGVAHGRFEACQDLPNINCANHETLTFGGWVKAGGATSFPEGASGGGGGGSWKR